MGTQQQRRLNRKNICSFFPADKFCVQDVFEDVFFGSILAESIIGLVIIGLPFEFKA